MNCSDGMSSRGGVSWRRAVVRAVTDDATYHITEPITVSKQGTLEL
jgi:hypothetical protein